MTLTPTSPVRRVERVRHEIRRRAVTVAAVTDLSPHLRRITLHGEALHDFVSLGFDDHLKVIVPDAQGAVQMRDYTPRQFDVASRTLTIEFALHGDGPAAQWARQAAVGQPLEVAGPRGSMVVPLDYPWHLLSGDSTALPAVQRRLEELPAGTRALVVMQVADDADRCALHSAAALEVHWAPDAASWLRTVAEVMPRDGAGFVWCAGESALMAQARQRLLDELGHPKEAARIAAYWKPAAAGFHENLSTPLG